MEREIMIKNIKKTLEQIRPYLQADGGDIEFIELRDDFTVKVKLLGACGACPFSLQTLKNGVEQSLKKTVPQIKAVIT